MTKDNKQTPEPSPDKKEKKQEDNNDPAVQRGKEAIEAQHNIDTEPEDVKKDKEKKDAEQWRNEG